MDVRLSDGTTLRVEDDPFNEGTEGETFKTVDGARIVKIYKAPGGDRRRTIERIVNYGAQSGESDAERRYWSGLIAWPIGVVDAPRLGSVTPFVPGKQFQRIILPRWLEKHPEDRGTLMGRIGIAVKLARAVRHFHFRGLCHSDLSDRNLLVDIARGAVTLIDNDGLVVPGIAPPQTNGTPGYQPPELVTKKEGPSTRTDLHSMSVLLYELLTLRHPLKGKRLGTFHPGDGGADDVALLGTDALYIEHPSDNRNRPATPLRFAVGVYGFEIARLFERTFVNGLFNPGDRPLANQWEAALVRLANTLVVCPNKDCWFGAYPFPQAVFEPGSPAGRGSSCPFCQTASPKPPSILRWYNVDRGNAGRPTTTAFVPGPGAKLHEWHVFADRPAGALSSPSPLAEFRVVDGRLSLVNLAINNLSARKSSDTAYTPVPIGRGVSMTPGNVIRFNGGSASERIAIVEDVP
jgi:DNA-binding helix-hairpin-helix protein with protein kinase domain